MPVVLVVAGVLAEVDGRDLEDAVAGAFAVAAERGAAPLVLGALDGGLRLLGLGERVGGDGAERQEVEKRGSSGGRHFGLVVRLRRAGGWVGWFFFLCMKKRCSVAF